MSTWAKSLHSRLVDGLEHQGAVEVEVEDQIKELVCIAFVWMYSMSRTIPDYLYVKHG